MFVSGGGYDNSTGVFTCPFSGAYVFIYHGLSENVSVTMYSNRCLDWIV